MPTKTQPVVQEPVGRVGQRRQVVIPREIFEKLNMREGDFVAFSQEGNGVLVKPKRLVDAGDALTQKETKQVRHALKQVAEGKTRPWSKIKDELGL